MTQQEIIDELIFDSITNIEKWLKIEDNISIDEFKKINDGFKRDLIRESWNNLMSYLCDIYDFEFLESINDRKDEIIEKIIDKINN